MSATDGRAERVLRAERFALPVVEQGPVRAAAPLKPLTASQLEALQQQAYDEAFAQGRKEGEKRGYDEGRKRALDA